MLPIFCDFVYLFFMNVMSRLHITEFSLIHASDILWLCLLFMDAVSGLQINRINVFFDFCCDSHYYKSSGVQLKITQPINVEWSVILAHFHLRKKERNVLFNNTLDTFTVIWHQKYGEKPFSKRGNLLPTHGLVFLISCKGSFICIIPQTG